MDSYQYYYSKNGEPAKGPVNLVQLLERVDKEHMVWRDGIDWMPVSDVPELKKFFPDATAKPASNKPASNNFETELANILNQLSLINNATAFKKLYVRGRVDAKKWNNFARNYAPQAVGSINDCLVYYDNTMFGKGDDGFLFTKYSFCWKNLAESAQFVYNRSDSPDFTPSAENIGFRINDAASFLVVNRASEHLVGGGFRLSCNFVDNKVALVEQLNNLLRLVKQR